jgi:hypothetical protein
MRGAYSRSSKRPALDAVVGDADEEGDALGVGDV